MATLGACWPTPNECAWLSVGKHFPPLFSLSWLRFCASTAYRLRNSPPRPWSLSTNSNACPTTGKRLTRKKNEMMQHLLLDLYQCSPALLADEALLRRFLNEMPAQIGMQPIGAETLYFIDSVSDANDAGHSGLMLASNHVSLHAWPPYEMINIDIFSRDAFNEAEVIAFVRATFAPGDIEVHAVKRATRWPDLLESGEKPGVPGGENTPPSPQKVAHRCLWPGGCLNSTGSAFMKYCPVHQDLLLPP
jgi:S-adenosylmethionine decarboxylase